MKNLFGFDSKARQSNNNNFIIRDLDSVGETKKLEEVMKSNLTARKKAYLPAWLVLPAYLFIFAGLILLCVGIPSDDTGITQTHLILLIVGGVLLALAMVVLAINFVRIRKLNADPYFKQSLEREEKLTDEALKIPENAEKIDFLVIDKPSKFPVYRMQTMKVFKENGLLCFSDNYEIIGIPLSQVMTAYAVNSKTRFTALEEMSKEKRVQYGIKRSLNNNGQNIIGSRLVVELQLNGEQYEIVVAGYNAEAFTKLLEKTAVII
ncbi:MAG: hypothetical protein J1G05_06690 [Clostridiales bacterium]|nr:hypothetical protein [Clostridiales bacterium]